MKKIIFTLLIILLNLSAFADTALNGQITTNTTLTVVASPYLVSSSLSVNTGVTLTIPAGVTIKFESGTNLIINGSLAATGATFTSSSLTPTRGSWGYVYFGDGTNSGTSTLNGCIFRWGSSIYVNNLYTANFTNTSTITEYSIQPLVLQLGSIASFTGSTISNSDNGVVSSGSLSFTNSLIFNVGNDNSGIIANAGSVSLDNSDIYGCKRPLELLAPLSLNLSNAPELNNNTLPAILLSFYSTVSGNFTLPAANVAYVFPSSFTVTSGCSLTVQNNAIVKFNPNTGLLVDGVLIANSTAGNSTFFTSMVDDNWGGDSNGDAGATVPGAGYFWQGIKFNSGSVDASCLLRRAQIRFATYCIETEDANPTIDLCQLSNNVHGLSMLRASNPVVTGNTFASSSLTPIAMAFEANPTFTSNGFSFSDNQFDAIGLYGGTLTANANIVQRSVTGITNITYVLLNRVTVPVGRTLTIQPGIVIKSQNSYYSNIIVAGTLIANGTVGSPIVFTSVKDDNFGNPGDTNKNGTLTAPSIGDFSSFVFETGSTGNSLNYCTIKYANGYNPNQSDYQGAALNFISASGTVQNCEIKDVSDGINCFLASTPAINNNQFINLGFAVSVSAAANPTFIGNTLTNNTYTALGLFGVGYGYYLSSELSVSGTIRQKTFAGFTNIVYVLRNSISIANGTNVNVEAGVVVKSAGNGIYVKGGFKIDGTVANPVIFTSVNDDNFGNPFDTNGDGNTTSASANTGSFIYFDGLSNDAYCNLTYFRIYFGNGYPSGMIKIENSNPVLNNVIVGNFAGYVAIGIYGNAAPAISNTTIQNGSYAPISVSLFSNPVFTNITFLSVAYSGLLINDASISSNATVAPRSLAGIANIPYLFESFTVNSGATLTIQAGCIFKPIYYYISTIQVYGALVISGTSTNKVVFTSLYDDSAGGDTNNDGNLTAPTPSSWSGFIFRDESVDATNNITHAEIRFAGSNSYNGAITFTNSGGILNQVTINFSYIGVGIFGTANPNMQNVSLENLSYPVRMDMFSSPTFGTITLNNITYRGLLIPSTTYSQTATVPVRNFAGFTNITYLLENNGNQTINSGTTLTIPAGITFKRTGGGTFIVNGKLIVSGTVSSYVNFTHLSDDLYGNPADTEGNGSVTAPSLIGPHIKFEDIADNTSSITYARFLYGTYGVSCVSAAPTVTNCQFSLCSAGILLEGNSNPSVTNNSFVNLTQAALSCSILAYPSSVTGNTISGSTWKSINILNETLSQDVTLPKRSFAGITNIPYTFSGFTVGTTATLTIAPGVVIKWQQSSSLQINKGLNAIGGFRADSNIVFTSIHDDFYGGDTNSDSLINPNPYVYNWGSIYINDVSIDALCSLKNCIVRFANTGVTITNANPSIQRCTFFGTGTGVSANGASNPTINFCDFYTPSSFGVNNVNLTFNINAENCWWGSNSGPTHPTNATGTGSIVTNQVDFTPFRSTGPNSPFAGDVSQNGQTQAFDAAKILQWLVSLTTLTSQQQTAGDVSGAGGLTASDASLILQFSSGLINRFPSEALRIASSDISLAVENVDAVAGGTVTVPVQLFEVSELFGSFAKILYDTTFVTFTDLDFGESEMSTAYNSPTPGVILIALAGVNAIDEDFNLANLHFTVKENAPVGLVIPITVDRYVGNETDLTSNAINGSITINSTVNVPEEIGQYELFVYPNPSSDFLTITIPDIKTENIELSVFDISGRKVIDKKLYNVISNGEYKLNLDGMIGGYYFIVLQSGQEVYKRRFFVSVN